MRRIVVIGGGAAGMMAAIAAADGGCRVTLIEKMRSWGKNYSSQARADAM